MRAKNIIYLLFFLQIIQMAQAQSLYDTMIDPLNPNIDLLEKALFKATNDARRIAKLPEFETNNLLMAVAQMHAKDMIEENFYGHQNPKNAAKRKISDRVKYIGKGEQPFYFLAENIAEYSLIDDFDAICYDKKNGRVFYFNCNNRQPIGMMTYRQLAVLVVKGWVESPAHRENLYNKDYKYLGTGVRLSKNPFTKPEIPFARLVQNFGG